MLIRVRIDVGGERKEGARRAGGVPKARGGARMPEESVSPAGDDLIAFVRHGVTVVVEASTPEAQKERRLFFEPAWVAEIPVCQATLEVGGHTGDVCINCQAAVSAPPSTGHEEEGVALADSSGGALDGIALNSLQLGALLVGRLGRFGAHCTRPVSRARPAPPSRAEVLVFLVKSNQVKSNITSPRKKDHIHKHNNQRTAFSLTCPAHWRTRPHIHDTTTTVKPHVKNLCSRLSPRPRMTHSHDAFASIRIPTRSSLRISRRLAQSPSQASQDSASALRRG